MRTYKAGKGEVCLSFDDYHASNARIDEILHTHGIEATFFIETGNAEARAQIGDLFKRGHDIGAHTIHHYPDLKQLPHVEAMGEIEGSKSMIESITGRSCTSFAYPRGRFNDEVVALVRKAGFSEARTTQVRATDWDDPFRMPTTLHLYEGRKEYAGRPLMGLVEFYLDDVVKNGGTFSLWGHAYEIERDNLWKLLERIVVLLGARVEL